MQIVNMGKTSAREPLAEADMHTDPIRQFESWFQEALAANLPEPNAMALATATADGHPPPRRRAACPRSRT